MSEQSVSEKLLQAAVYKRVSDELGKLFQQLAEFTDKMNMEDAKKAKALLLNMVACGSSEFIAKMADRIDKLKSQPE
ncbi:hypothetical protein A3C91_01370 [Candidatus Azambacteria bacterium RIFCSPHIGHO2_02_FULL_52_12]|uniref:Uncharacterized protein n=1 Tax=Candidatus Azambacteria bacterium RIFCSPLOWO2_01_FULL_46_25 TaxID=1797298 RepID=A0A1F5BVE3_9BACT|nr:MAG: hypothetical protein A3C91_01370 [Candidatus Azambacteria bacterium RIFCSPHIGHO2_02_FULL_52_12]OGD34538.1 MAG: hypothetical protein A2988_03430 [Candidatus Azambacteria bacterium RIFCSPLOWO2_01_FULL_46_25]OGD36412.1 MAG: hypothetical protein A2850_01930 [Candidatus Azambacteria bacterium RIFCSPHIGHO2_01_FULL_51_74]